MDRKCDTCFWGTAWEGSEGIFPICERHWYSFEEAKGECDKPGACEHYVIPEEVNKIADVWNNISN